MKIIRLSKVKVKTKINGYKCKSRVKTKVKLWKGGVNRMSVVVEKPVVLAPMAKMKQMAQKAMKAKGLTGGDVRRMIGIKRYEQED